MLSVPSPLPDEFELRISGRKRAQLLVIFLGFIVFVLIGIWIARRGDPIGWLVIAFFGLASLACLHMLIFGEHLRLYREGFEQVIFGRGMVCKWDEVSEFRVQTIRQGFLSKRLVCFSREADHGRQLGLIARVLSGGAARLSNAFDMSADDLADLMNAFRERALAEAKAQPAAVRTDAPGVSPQAKTACFVDDGNSDNAHMLTFEWIEEIETLEICGDREGLQYFAQRLASLAERQGRDHEHFMTEAWGGWEISAEKNNVKARKINHVRVWKSPDEQLSHLDE